MKGVFLTMQASSRTHRATTASPNVFGPSTAWKQFSFETGSPLATPCSITMKTALPQGYEDAKTPPPAASTAPQPESSQHASAISLGSVDIQGLLQDPNSPMCVFSPAPLPGAASWWDKMLAASPSSCLSVSSSYASSHSDSNMSSRSNQRLCRGSVASWAGSPVSSTGSERDHLEESPIQESASTPTPAQAQTWSPSVQGSLTLSPASALCVTPCVLPLSQVTFLSLFSNAMCSIGVYV